MLGESPGGLGQGDALKRGLPYAAPYSLSNPIGPKTALASSANPSIPTAPTPLTADMRGSAFILKHYISYELGKRCAP